jgi:hypothetical protein
MPLEGDWQRAELARSVTLPGLGWPNNRLQWIWRYAPLYRLNLIERIFPFRELVLPPNR